MPHDFLYPNCQRKSKSSGELEEMARFHIVLLSYLLFVGAIATQTEWKDWQHGRIRSQDVQIHFKYAGKGPPVFLVHGFPQHSVSPPHRLPTHLPPPT